MSGSMPERPNKWKKLEDDGSKREVCVCDYVCVTCFLLSIKLK